MAHQYGQAMSLITGNYYGKPECELHSERTVPRERGVRIDGLVKGEDQKL